MKKRLFTFILVISTICLLCACANESSKDSSETKSSASSSISQSNDVKELSKKLCLEMAEDDFEETYNLFSENMRTQLDKSGLISAWEKVAADTGDYKEYHFVSVTEQEDYTIVTSALEYEQKGIVVTLVYNLSQELDGLWLDNCGFTHSGEIVLPTTEALSESAEAQ